MRKSLLFLLCALLSVSAFAEDRTSGFVFNIKRIGLDWSKTDVRNAAEYSDSPIQALKASNQDYIKGVGDVVLEYRNDRLKWDNGLFTEYGKTTLSPHGAPKTKNENADKILATSDFSYAVWDFSNARLGPMARGQYETEYTKNGGVPRQNLARASGGFSLFDHPVVKNLYVAGVYEYDFTYSGDPVGKFAAEVGWLLEYQIRDGVKLSSSGYYREYLDYSSYVGTDLRRDLSATLRMDTNLWGSLTMGPYIQYRRAKSRETDMYGSNFMIGVSFNYITKFDLR